MKSTLGGTVPRKSPLAPKGSNSMWHVTAGHTSSAQQLMQRR